MLAAVKYCLPGRKKRPRCWCWAEPPSSPRAPSLEPALWQSWWHGAGWRGDWFRGTSCRGSAPRCRAPRREGFLSDAVESVPVMKRKEELRPRPRPLCFLEPGCPGPARSGRAPCRGHALTCSDDPSRSKTYKTSHKRWLIISAKVCEKKVFWRKQLF